MALAAGRGAVSARRITSDADAHTVTPEEYDEIPELTEEWFDGAELRLTASKCSAAVHDQRPASCIYQAATISASITSISTIVSTES
jgi:hypothetical protein